MLFNSLFVHHNGLFVLQTNAVLCTLQGELNGHKGLVPSNFLEEVPDDVEVYLTDSPSRYVQDTPARIKTKRVHAPSQY